MMGTGTRLSTPLGTVVYDAENRIKSMSAAAVQYKYDSRNKRIWKSILSAGNLSQEVYFCGVDGQKIGTYTIQLVLLNGNIPQMSDNTGIKLSTFFGSKRLGTYDRLGSAKFNANGQQQSFYPYGEDRGTVQPNDSLKFATYTRDTATGLDYADQRYYANNFGRFMSPDPGPAVLTIPQSWNRYSYAINDPVNNNDPGGDFWGPNGCFASTDELIAATSDASIGCPVFFFGPELLLVKSLPDPEKRVPRGRSKQLNSYVQQGLIDDWEYVGGNVFSLSLVETGPLAVGVCVAQPELCVLVGVGAVITIYVLAPAIEKLIEAIRRQITSRDAAPVRYDPYDAGRDSNGNCKPPDPNKFVKWQGTGGDHWHWITWHQRPKDCMTFPDYESGPDDPGPEYREIPR